MPSLPTDPGRPATRGGTGAEHDDSPDTKSYVSTTGLRNASSGTAPYHNAPDGGPGSAADGITNIRPITIGPPVFRWIALAPTSPSQNTRIRPIVGKAALQMPNQTGMQPVATSNIRPSSNMGDLAGIEGLMPKFARRRSEPKALHVPTDAFDAEMMGRSEGDVVNFKNLDTRAKSEKEENKGEHWTMINELATLALCVFGQFGGPLAIGVYIMERSATLRRQGKTERDRLWGKGIRAPIGARIAHAASTPQRGALGSEGFPDDTLLESDFAPWIQDSYFKYPPGAKKNESRRKHALRIGEFAKLGKHRDKITGLIYGKGRCEGRLECLDAMERAHDARPELFTVYFSP